MTTPNTGGLRSPRTRHSSSLENARLSQDTQPKKHTQLAPIITVSAPPPPTKVDINAAKNASLSGSSSSASSRYSRRPMPISLLAGKEKAPTNESSPGGAALSRAPSKSMTPVNHEDSRRRSSTVSLLQETLPPSDVDLRRDDIFTILKRTGGVPESKESGEGVQWNSNMTPLSKSGPSQRPTSLVFPRVRRISESTAKQQPRISDSITHRQPKNTSSSSTPRTSKMPVPLRLNWRQSPASPPPAESLPFPPDSVPPTASTIAPETQTPKPSLAEPQTPTSSTIVSASNSNTRRRSYTPIPHTRSRTDTLSSTNSAVSRDQKSVKSYTHADPQRAGSGTPSISRAHGAEGTNLSTIHSNESSSDNPATLEQLRDTLNSQSTRYAKLSAYLIELTERHAAEKLELLRRIDLLEREAQKREREIKGLRWLVTNANHKGSTSSSDRFRTLSRASQISIGPHPSPDIEDASSTTPLVDSTIDSFDEDLSELQTVLSDLIEPFMTSPSGDVNTSNLDSDGTDLVRLTRSNTLPGNRRMVHSPKQSRRTSSPVLPAGSSPRAGRTTSAVPSSGTSTSSSVGGIGTGLPFDAFSRVSEPYSLPSLTATDSDSSVLSELPDLPERHQHVLDPIMEKQTLESEARQMREESDTPRPSGRPPTPSSPATLASASLDINLVSIRIPPPLIEQVIDEVEQPATVVPN